MAELDEETRAMARQAGLDLALERFPEDVAAAANDARLATGDQVRPREPAAEPWPPMRAERP